MGDISHRIQTFVEKNANEGKHLVIKGTVVNHNEIEMKKNKKSKSNIERAKTLRQKSGCFSPFYHFFNDIFRILEN